jgi:hypothetical protein
MIVDALPRSLGGFPQRLGELNGYWLGHPARSLWEKVTGNDETATASTVSHVADLGSQFTVSPIPTNPRVHPRAQYHFSIQCHRSVIRF